jgi:hypothetical protein
LTMRSVANIDNVEWRGADGEQYNL